VSLMDEIKRETASESKSDIINDGWIERTFPARARPFAYLARLDRPIGVWLLLWPGLWGITLAAGGFGGLAMEHIILAALFFIGAIVMRGAGCVVNDMWDRKLDQKVTRTRTRPIASGAVSMRAAFIFLALLLVCGLIILMQMNALTIMLGVAVLPLIIAYPFMKRITWWPQAFLGITFNFSALMGWSAVTGDLSFAAFLLYTAAIFWTLGYDTVYAFQDAEDDALAGIKSTALRFGAAAKRWVSGFYALTAFGCAAAFYMLGAHWTGYAALMLFALHAMWQLREWHLDDARSSLRVFKSNHATGALILIACLAI